MLQFVGKNLQGKRNIYLYSIWGRRREVRDGGRGGLQFRGVFRNRSNIYNGAFFSKIDYFRKKVPSQMFDCVLNTPLWALVFVFITFFSANFDLLSLMFIIYGSYYLNFRTMQNCTICSKLILYGRIVVGLCLRTFAKFLF